RQEAAPARRSSGNLCWPSHAAAAEAMTGTPPGFSERAPEPASNGPAMQYLDFVRSYVRHALNRKPDSHVAPYRQFWNPDEREKRRLAFRYRMAGDGHAVSENERRILSWRDAYKGKRA